MLNDRLGPMHGGLRRRALGLLAGALVPGAVTAQVHDAVLERPLPQVQRNSCQSYALAYSLAYRYPDMFPVTSSYELRDLEQRVRAAIKKAGGPGNEYSRTSWRGAVVALSEGKLTLVEEWFREETALLDRVNKIAGDLTPTTQPTDLQFRLSTTIPVLLSVSSIEGQDYAGKNQGSHIVTVLAASPERQSPRRMLVLNPAIKDGGTWRDMCAPFDTFSETDRRGWETSVSVAEKYRFKHLVITCVRSATSDPKAKCE